MLSSDLIAKGSKILKQNLIKSHLLDAEIILSKILNKEREILLVSDDLIISKKQIRDFNLIIKKRIKKEPIAYIFNNKDFWKYDFHVDRNTLIPRPETELLVEKVIKFFFNKKPLILDVGTGSGCIIISLLSEIKKSKGIGIDISKSALNSAKKNAIRHNVNNRVKFVNTSITSNFNSKFDLIVSNPPYINRHQIKNLPLDVKNFEPRLALDGGNDGLDVIRKVIYKARTILKVSGMLAIEIGNGQYKKVSQILKLKNFREKFLIKDYQDNIRCILSILKSK